MGRERTDYERMVDDALLLSLWALAQERSPTQTVGGRIKATKLAFMAAYPLFIDKIKAFNFEFFKFTHGPMARHLTDTVEELRLCGLAYEDEEIVLTDAGISLGKAIFDEVVSLPANSAIRHEIDRVAFEYGPQSLDDILDHVYAMKVYTLERPGQRRTVKAINKHETLTKIIEDEDADQVIEIPRGWEITLNLSRTPGALGDLQRSMEDTFQGRVYSSDEFWQEIYGDLHPAV